MRLRYLLISFTLLHTASYADTGESPDRTETEEVSIGNLRCLPMRPPSKQKVPVAAKKPDLQPEAKPTKATASTVSPSSEVEFGGSFAYLRMDAGGDALQGFLGGAQASYEYKVANSVYGGVAFAFRDGSVSKQEIKRSILDINLQERLGYSFGNTEETWLVSLFSGLGYRHMGETASASDGSSVLNYNDFYIPVGFLIQGTVHPLVTLGLNAQWQPQVYPTVTTTPLNGARWITICELGSFAAELPIVVSVYKKYHCTVIVKPFVEYWQDGRTTAKTDTGLSLGIPANHYWFVGCDINVGFAF